MKYFIMAVASAFLLTACLEDDDVRPEYFDGYADGVADCRAGVLAKHW